MSALADPLLQLLGPEVLQLPQPYFPRMGFPSQQVLWQAAMQLQIAVLAVLQ